MGVFGPQVTSAVLVTQLILPKCATNRLPRTTEITNIQGTYSTCKKTKSTFSSFMRSQCKSTLSSPSQLSGKATNFHQKAGAADHLRLHLYSTLKLLYKGCSQTEYRFYPISFDNVMQLKSDSYVKTLLPSTQCSAKLKDVHVT